MYQSKKYYLLFIALLLGGYSVAQTSRVGSKDNPPMPQANQVKIPKPIRKFYGKKGSKLLQEASIIEAYHLVEGVTAQAGFKGYKVITKVAKLSVAQTKALRSILFNPRSYIFDKVGKKCEFRPNLGFRFISGQDSLECLVALNCSVINYAYLGSQKTEDCDPAHNPFLKLCRSVFPTAFKDYPNRSTPSGYRDDIPGRPAQRPELPSLPVGPPPTDSTRHATREKRKVLNKTQKQRKHLPKKGKVKSATKTTEKKPRK